LASASFIQNSDRLIILVNRFYKVWQIHNIETNIHECIIVILDSKNIYDTNRDVFIANDYDFRTGRAKIYIYDAKTIVLIKIIKHRMNFVAYNKKIDVLITDSFEYYTINSSFDFEKVIVGHNYRIECHRVSNFIMDVILETCVLFESLPDEILNIEMYHQLLLFFDF